MVVAYSYVNERMYRGDGSYLWKTPEGMHKSIGRIAKMPERYNYGANMHLLFRDSCSYAPLQELVGSYQQIASRQGQLPLLELGYQGSGSYSQQFQSLI
jgi:hypothetical protein